ncbi:hypothetical protein [Peribacillus muralis]|uniref:hypothetical protein n=1 Tax=Peribacillus muralis TaxID=264697 RepID=UPI003D00432D
MSVSFHCRRSLSAGGRGALSAHAPMRSPLDRIPAGVSHLPFHSADAKPKLASKSTKLASKSADLASKVAKLASNAPKW